MKRRDAAAIAIEALTVEFEQRRGAPLLAVDRLSLDIAEGEIVCILGPSGCGKSTLLNAIAGFLTPTSGRVLVNGCLVVGPAPDRGFVLQQHGLFPWKTAAGNIEFGLRMQGVPREERHQIRETYLARVGLTEFAAAYPRSLSGGMQQRVAIARALCGNPAVLLMDEPFGSLDAHTRLSMRELLLALWGEERKTILFVTHDVDEALMLADRIVFLTARPGRVEQIVQVTLPRPRTLSALSHPEFLRLKQLAVQLIRRHAGL